MNPFAGWKPVTHSAGSECGRGAVLGAVSGLTMAGIGGATIPICVLVAGCASALGALIALLVWSASCDVPEDPVLPPREDLG